MYSFCAHHLTSTVERQEEIRIGAASATNGGGCSQRQPARQRLIKLGAVTSTRWLMKPAPQTHKHLQKYWIRRHLLSVLLLLWSVDILNDKSRIISKDPRASGERLSCNIDRAAAVKPRGGGEPEKTEVRSIKGSVLYGCAGCVVGTLCEEDHPVNETYTTKNTDSQWSSDGHFTKSCESHTPAGHTILSLSLPLAQSIEPSPVLQGFSM